MIDARAEHLADQIGAGVAAVRRNLAERRRMLPQIVRRDAVEHRAARRRQHRRQQLHDERRLQIDEAVARQQARHHVGVLRGRFGGERRERAGWQAEIETDREDVPRAHAGPDADDLRVLSWFATISSSSGSTAVWPRSMIDRPPIWITFRLGRIARTGDFASRRSPVLSISDSRIRRETTCCAPAASFMPHPPRSAVVEDDGADRLAVERGGQLARLQPVDELDLLDVARVAA